jgi:hypothetical protein
LCTSERNHSKFEGWKLGINALWSHLIIIVVVFSRQSTTLILLHHHKRRHQKRSSRLVVLPGTGIGGVAGKSAEAKALVVELEALKGGVDLPGALLLLAGAGKEAAGLVAENTEAVAGSGGPAGLDGALGDGGAVGDGVLDGTGVGLDVDLLATGDDNAHAEGALTAGEGGEVAGGAGAELLDVLGAVGGGGLVKPDGLAGGGQGLVVDGGGRAGGSEAEVLGRGGGEEAGEGGDGGGGLHVGGCVGVVWFEVEVEIEED